MKICVYAIAKNESKNVAAWVKSMSEADGIYVLDTGSTDDTVDQLKRLGVNVAVHNYGEGEFTFCDARNRSLALLPKDCDLAVCTDLDETFSDGWRAEVERQWLEAKKSNPAVVCAEYDYFFAIDEQGNPTARFNQFKIHEPSHGHWIYYCHEVLDYDVPRVVVFIGNIRLYHHQDHTKERSKFYLSLLEKQTQDAPQDCRASHYLGREYMYHGRWDDAIKEFTRHLSLPNGWKPERAQSMRYMGRCYRALGNVKDCFYWLTKAIAEEPTQREAAVELSQIASEEKDFEVCTFAAQAALQVKTHTRIYITQESSWGALPYHLLSVGITNKESRTAEDWRKGSVAASVALRMNPYNETYWWNMIHLNGQSPVYPPLAMAEGLTAEWNERGNPHVLPNWDMFDHIYCIHYLGNRGREEGMRNEFTRVGLWNHPKFSVWEAVRTVYEERYLNWNHAGVINLALQTLKIMLTAKAKGYKRILIWEDDVRMLKDTGLMAEIFANTPDTDIVVYDKLAFIFPPKMQDICLNGRIKGNKWFCPWERGIYSCSCYALNEKAMDALIAKANEKLIPIDDAYQADNVKGLTRSFSVVNTSVQVLDDVSMFPERFGQFNAKNGYAFQGIDFRRYNVPAGYGYDSPVDATLCER